MPEDSIFDLISAASALCLIVLFALVIPATPAIPRFPSGISFEWAVYFTQVVVTACVFILTFFPRRRDSSRPLWSWARTTVLLGLWSTYAYRNLLPLATYNGVPMDVAAEGDILWAKIGVLTFSAIILPLISPRHRRVAHEGNHEESNHVEFTPSILSLLTYAWLDPLILKAQGLETFEVNEMPQLADYNHIGYLINSAREGSNAPGQSGGRPPSRTASPIPASGPTAPADQSRPRWSLNPIHWVYAWMSGKKQDAVTKGISTLFSARQDRLVRELSWLFRKDLTIEAGAVVLASASTFLQPLALKHILSFVEDGVSDDNVRPWVWLIILFVGCLANPMFYQFYQYVSTQVVARTQAIITNRVFEHSLKLRAAHYTSRIPDGAIKQAPIPNISNLVTTDLMAVTNASTFVLLILIETPIQLVLSTYFLYVILGWSAFVGVGVMIFLFPVPTMLTELAAKYRKGEATKMDVRVSLTQQTVEAIRTVKLLGWQKQQGEKLQKARDDELESTAASEYMKIWVRAVTVFLPLLVMLASYTTFTFLMQRDLTASIVFSSISLFETLRAQLGQIFFRFPILSSGQISLDRINRFLTETELLDQHVTPGCPGRPEDPEAIEIKEAKFSWTVNDAPFADEPQGSTEGSVAPADKHKHFILEVPKTVTFQPRVLNMVSGATGCGKTSLLLALLGEMHYIPGSNSSYVNLPRAKVAYSAQRPWILSDTVKNNVVFGTQYNEGWFRQVMNAVDFEVDMKDWKDGAETRVGERGVTLSGGQKARLSLARAIYSDADIVLLDDVLSQVDAETIAHILERCFGVNGVLKGRTVIFVTHQTDVVHRYAQAYVTFSDTGVVNECSFDFDVADAETATVHQNIADEEVHLESPTARKQEQKQRGHVGWKAITLLFGNMSAAPGLFWIGLVVSFFAASLALNAQVWLLGYWADQYVVKALGSDSTIIMLSYVALMITSLVLAVFSNRVYLHGALRASGIIHQKLVSRLLGTTLQWLDDTPTEHILQRCTGDIGFVDAQVAGSLFTLLQSSTALLLRLALVAVVAPLFSIGVAVTGVIGGIITRLYMKAQLPINRLQSRLRAPLLGNINTTFQGLVSVRAYKAEILFRNRMHTDIDNVTRVGNTFFDLNRWVTLRANLTGAVFTVSLAAYLLYFSSASASNIGFSLNMAIAFTTQLFEWVRNFNNFELSGVALERIQEYLVIPQEEDTVGATQVDSAWPEEGSIDVTNLYAGYGNNTVIHDINFNVAPGTRVGIVGRTGSGKSTLLLALLRFVQSHGDVKIGGRSIADIDLATLRKKITIVPQTSDLFEGTIRSNMDPFNEFTDEQCASALLAAQGMDDPETDDKRPWLELDRDVAARGAKLSSGERQIVTIARAIVRGSKVVLFDEATSSIDVQTDDRIQKAFYRHMKRTNTTVIVIAHRLSTIKDCDKVLVFDQGRIVESDTWIELLQNEDGFAANLLKAAGTIVNELYRQYTMVPESQASSSSGP
ncbi:P-loop containing nucleoside triphosphate hydrolase protein [Epithele typhae]|uniref:P-loop containing nucleoside triphosphate hydrolase protein n=1 Tax=Epithele typhae TaxID=378194 RepID=UPI0020073AF5|nr:P-loop containing nucleoside triphosphate hydrolase protein [Epithele typhae]KAH9915165.1 P-loop containing nucleoside triphosphate hydrolase protein [Epithele typhae]